MALGSENDTNEVRGSSDASHAVVVAAERTNDIALGAIQSAPHSLAQVAQGVLKLLLRHGLMR